MWLNLLTDGLKIPRKKFIAATLLVSGTLAWFFLIHFSLTYIFNPVGQSDPYWTNLGRIMFYGSAVFAAISGSLITHRINRTKLLITWILLGIFATFSLIIFQGTSFLAVSGLLLGLSFGFGLPSSMAFMAECTAVDERARVSGVIILSTFILAFATLAIIRVLQLDIATYIPLTFIVLLAAVRGVSLIALAIDKCKPQDANILVNSRLQKQSFKEFAYYLAPWVMFAIAAGLLWNIIPDTPEYESAVSLGTTLRFVFIAVFGLVSGVVADRVGRKPPIIFGLITLAFSFVLLGFDMNLTTVLIYLISSGIAWGSFFVIFLAVPGDLSDRGSREKFYGLGYILPLGILFALGALPGEAIFSNQLASRVALLLSIILFAAIIPVWRARETLSSKQIDERRIKEHMKKIEEIVKKETDAENT